MVQMPLSARKGVTTNRADDMVLAGSAPTPAHGADPIAHIHRGTTFIVLVDAAIVIYLLYTAVQAIGWGSELSVSIFFGSSLITGLMVYTGYRNRRQWAYWPAVVILILASLMFGFLAFLNLLQTLATGMLSPLLFVFLLGWAGLGSGRRAIFHWHPAYRAGYARLTSEQAFQLQDGEMLAACPNCLAVLAIQPTMLGK
ncbi:MAG: hypothetical protein DWC01_00335, partial [Candidatus Poseidoniales archaeon]